MMLGNPYAETQQLLNIENEWKRGGSKREHHTFIIESVDSIDTCTFMVATKNEKVLRVFNLVSEEKTYRFKRLFAPIHIIAQEQIICLGREAAVLK